MDLIKQLADYGVSYLLLAISLLINWRLGTMLLAEKDKRVTAAEKVRDDLTAPLKNIQETQGLIYEKIKISKEAQA